jgi:hypothetical protein
MSSTVNPSLKVDRISSWLTRRGPASPGTKSLKHNRKYLLLGWVIAYVPLRVDGPEQVRLVAGLDFNRACPKR